MSAAIQSVLTDLRQNDYVTLAALTAVGYDYVLTFSSEIEYIWNKPWTWVSTLFILVRYCGLLNLIIITLFVSILVESVPCLIHLRSIAGCFQGGIIHVISGWTFILFAGAADFIMILRVWAVYNRSRLILGALLMLFFPGIILTVVAVAIYSDPRNLSVVTTQIQTLDVAFCTVQPIPLIWMNLAAILGITNSAVVCIFMVVQFVRQSLQMYRVTKQWQLNQYMNLLAQQGVLYFFAIFLFALINALAASGKLPTGGWRLGLLSILEYVPMYTLTPRFAMSIRELYARDVQGRRGGGIDTGFGLLPTSHGAAGTTIVFTDVEQNQVSEEVEEIQAEARTTQPE